MFPPGIPTVAFPPLFEIDPPPCGGEVDDPPVHQQVGDRPCVTRFHAPVAQRAGAVDLHEAVGGLAQEGELKETVLIGRKAMEIDQIEV